MNGNGMIFGNIKSHPIINLNIDLIFLDLNFDMYFVKVCKDFRPIPGGNNPVKWDQI